MTRVILADDHTLVRAGIRQLLEKLPEVTVVAEMGDGREAVAAIEKHRPNSGFNGHHHAGPQRSGGHGANRQAIPLRQDHHALEHTSHEYVMQAFRVGVAGYLLKDAATIETGSGPESGVGR